MIIIGTGAGALAHRLAPTGKRILVLERGRFLPREKENWEPREVFGKERYHAPETWLDDRGSSFRPGTGYCVGGNTKVFGGAMFRLRERDFDEVVHRGGISPAWPVTYRDLEPYYVAAEAIYQVHGLRGVDPTEPWSSAPYPWPPVSHEERIQELCDGLERIGHHPFPLPLSIRLDETDPVRSPCIRCSTCDGFPCLVDAKADADVSCVRPIARAANVDAVTAHPCGQQWKAAATDVYAAVSRLDAIAGKDEAADPGTPGPAIIRAGCAASTRSSRAPACAA